MLSQWMVIKVLLLMLSCSTTLAVCKRRRGRGKPQPPGHSGGNGGRGRSGRLTHLPTTAASGAAPGQSTDLQEQDTIRKIGVQYWSKETILEEFSMSFEMLGGDVGGWEVYYFTRLWFGQRLDGSNNADPLTWYTLVGSNVVSGQSWLVNYNLKRLPEGSPRLPLLQRLVEYDFEEYANTWRGVLRVPKLMKATDAFHLHCDGKLVYSGSANGYCFTIIDAEQNHVMKTEADVPVYNVPVYALGVSSEERSCAYILPYQNLAFKCTARYSTKFECFEALHTYGTSTQHHYDFVEEYKAPLHRQCPGKKITGVLLTFPEGWAFRDMMRGLEDLNMEHRHPRSRVAQ